MRAEYAPINDPTIHPPVLEPGPIESAEFSFKESTRNWWMRVGNWTCQYEWYDDKKGWQKCRSSAKDVHHIIPEGWLLQHGEDPEHSIGMPLCKAHHVKNTGDEIFDEHSSFHPDMSQAYLLYKEWKRQQLHFVSMGTRRTIDYKTSPFAEAAYEHYEMALREERYWTGTEDTDLYFIQKMMDMATRYQLDHPEDVKPKTDPHPRTDKRKAKHWYDA